MMAGRVAGWQVIRPCTGIRDSPNTTTRANECSAVQHAAEKHKISALVSVAFAFTCVRQIC
jgi:hypothetical protein